jgi:DNA-binding transcriptional LysR family regulator
MRNEFTGGFNAAVADLFRKHNVTAGAKVQTGSVETMLGMVASGMGIAMVSSVVKFMLVSGVVLLPLEPGPMFKSLYVAWPIRCFISESKTNYILDRSRGRIYSMTVQAAPPHHGPRMTGQKEQ